MNNEHRYGNTVCRPLILVSLRCCDLRFWLKRRKFRIKSLVLPKSHLVSWTLLNSRYDLSLFWYNIMWFLESTSAENALKQRETYFRMEPWRKRFGSLFSTETHGTAQENQHFWTRFSRNFLHKNKGYIFDDQIVHIFNEVHRRLQRGVQ